MGFKCGIVGLPNVGKSTLFNALTSSERAESENYPFCTIDPNVSVVDVPDERLYRIAEIASSKNIVHTTIEFVDIAGLVRGASKGEGLGNKFLSHIRDVDAICYVLRCFEDENIVHVNGKIDPIEDISTIETELILSDIDRLQKILDKKKTDYDLSLAKKVLKVLDSGMPAISVLQEDQFNLLTSKPFFYISNVSEDDILTGNSFTKAIDKNAEIKNTKNIKVSVKTEQDLTSFSEQEKEYFFKELGINCSSLKNVVEAGYNVLDLGTYFTVGPKEARAWTFKKGINARSAAGIIHTDFEKGFICADTISYEDYIKFGGEIGARNSGKLRQEGRDYIVIDGDILLFKFNVSK